MNSVVAAKLRPGDVLEAANGHRPVVAWAEADLRMGLVRLLITSENRSGVPYGAMQTLNVNERVRRVGASPNELPSWVQETADLRIGDRVVVTTESRPPGPVELPQLEYLTSSEWFHGEDGFVADVYEEFVDVRLPPGRGAHGFGLDVLNATGIWPEEPDDRIVRLRRAELIKWSTCAEMVRVAEMEQQMRLTATLDPTKPAEASEIYRRLEMDEVTIRGMSYGLFRTRLDEARGEDVTCVIHAGQYVAEIFTSHGEAGLSVDDLNVAEGFRRKGIGSFLLVEAVSQYLKVNPGRKVTYASTTAAFEGFWQGLAEKGAVDETQHVFDYFGAGRDSGLEWRGCPAEEKLAQWDTALTADITDEESYGPDPLETNVLFSRPPRLLIEWGLMAPTLEALTNVEPDLDWDAPF